jgi:L-ascorbate metabolism protein UlaG (beta-lactamase superfamily)
MNALNRYSIFLKEHNMKLNIIFFAIITLITANVFGQSIKLSSNDLLYYKKQNEFLSTFLCSYFDNNKPEYQSEERKVALYLVDTITHYPAPHEESLKNMFLDRYKTSLDRVKSTEIEKGVAIWNVYNMSYVVKSPEITIAFDLIRLPGVLRGDQNRSMVDALAKQMVEQCDVLFVSHEHSDHIDSFVANEFISQGKPVIAHSGLFKDDDFYEDIVKLPRDGKQRKLVVGDSSIQVRIYPGHQAVTQTRAVDNNYTFATLPCGITIAHSGDQSWVDDFEWLDSIYTEVQTDILMTNTWTKYQNKVFDGIKPKIVLPGHINEMGHNISTRIPYWESYIFWQDVIDNVVHLFWGETYLYNSENE